MSNLTRKERNRLRARFPELKKVRGQERYEYPDLANGSTAIAMVSLVEPKPYWQVSYVDQHGVMHFEKCASMFQAMTFLTRNREPPLGIES